MIQKLILIALSVSIGSSLIASPEAMAEANETLVDSTYSDKVRALLDKEEFNEAIVILDTQVKLHPEDVTAFTLLGDVHLKLGVPDESERFFAKALLIDSSDVEAMLGMAKASFSNGNFAKAKTLLLKCIALEPGEKLAYGYLGQILITEGDIDEARKNFENLLKIDPENVDALNNLGVLYQQAGNELKAELFLKKVVELYPNDGIGYLNLAVLYGTMNRMHDAVVLLNKAATLTPRDKRVFQSLGTLYLQHKIYNEAEKNFLKAMTLDPLSVNARFGLVIVYQEQEKFIDALRFADEMSWLAEDYPQLHLIIGNLYFLKGDYDSAIVHAEKQVEREPNEPAGHYMLALLNKLKGKNSQADWELEQVRFLLQKDPALNNGRKNMNLLNLFGKKTTKELRK